MFKVSEEENSFKSCKTFYKQCDNHFQKHLLDKQDYQSQGKTAGSFKTVPGESQKPVNLTLLEEQSKKLWICVSGQKKTKFESSTDLMMLVGHGNIFKSLSFQCFSLKSEKKNSAHHVHFTFCMVSINFLNFLIINLPEPNWGRLLFFGYYTIATCWSFQHSLVAHKKLFFSVSSYGNLSLCFPSTDSNSVMYA